MSTPERPDDPLVHPAPTPSARRSQSSSSPGGHRPVKESSSLEELLYYKGQPALFYPARLQPPEADLVGAYFPSKLAKTFSMAQMLIGALMVALGIVALLVRASLAGWGGGIWAGSLVLMTGLAGMVASARPASAPHIVTFMILSIFAVATAGLQVVLAATGLATDANTPSSHYVDDEGRRVSFLGEVALSTPAVAANGILVVLSVMACLLSIGCCVLSAREACQCYGTFASSDSSCLQGSADTDMRRDRLLNWLGQQAVVNTLPPGKGAQLVSASPNGKWAPGKKVTYKASLVQNPSVSSKSTVPSRLSSYAEGGSGEPKEQPAVVEPVDVPPAKLDDKYLAIDKKMAEDYIERLIETDEKRLCAAYEVIAQEAVPITSLKRSSKQHK